MVTDSTRVDWGWGPVLVPMQLDGQNSQECKPMPALFVVLCDLDL